MWRRVVEYEFTDGLEKHAASIVRVEQRATGLALSIPCILNELKFFIHDTKNAPLIHTNPILYRCYMFRRHATNFNHSYRNQHGSH
jgi:hypothetical protein